MAGYKGSQQKGARPITNTVTGQTVVDGTGGCTESLTLALKREAEHGDKKGVLHGLWL